MEHSDRSTTAPWSALSEGLDGIDRARFLGPEVAPEILQTHSISDCGALRNMDTPREMTFHVETREDGTILATCTVDREVRFVREGHDWASVMAAMVYARGKTLAPREYESPCTLIRTGSSSIEARRRSWPFRRSPRPRSGQWCPRRGQRRQRMRRL